jgi:hypothetical protein
MDEKKKGQEEAMKRIARELSETMRVDGNMEFSSLSKHARFFDVKDGIKWCPTQNVMISIYDLMVRYDFLYHIAKKLCVALEFKKPHSEISALLAFLDEAVARVDGEGLTQGSRDKLKPNTPEMEMRVDINFDNEEMDT